MTAMALMAGNSVVIKPSELTPLTGLRIGEIFAKAGAPEGLVQIVTGAGETGAALVEAAPDKIMFTGSVATGKKIAAARAKLLEIARQGETPELRITAIRVLSDHGLMGLEELLQLYSAETNVQIKQGLLRTFGNNKDPRAQAKLLEVARGTDPVELRGYAIRQLREKDDEQTVGQLVAIYDGEQNQQVKMGLIRAFGDSRQKVAVRKLMTIARNDPSVELRKVAVRYLGESKDPEALKFLEDLLK